MIKVFTSVKNSVYVGDDLTSQFEEWKNSFSPNRIEIKGFHTNSNKFGWMLTIHYEIAR
jgi:hypothetical protein